MLENLGAVFACKVHQHCFAGPERAGLVSEPRLKRGVDMGNRPACGNRHEANGHAVKTGERHFESADALHFACAFAGDVVDGPHNESFAARRVGRVAYG